MEPQSPTPPMGSPSEPLPPPPGGWGQLANPGAPAPQQAPPPGWGQQPPASAWSQPQSPGGPPPGWGQQQPQQGPPPGWVQQPGQGGPPPGWVQQPQQPPQGWGPPQQGWVQPGPMWVQKMPVSPLAKIGAVFLVVVSIFFILFGLLAMVGGGAFSNLGQGNTFGGAIGGAILVVGVILLVIGILQLLSGIFAWRGSGGGRVGGIIFGLLFGVLGLLGAVGSTSQAGGGSSVVGIVVAVGYLYTAGVFMFAFRAKA